MVRSLSVKLTVLWGLGKCPNKQKSKTCTGLPCLPLCRNQLMLAEFQWHIAVEDFDTVQYNKIHWGYFIYNNNLYDFIKRKVYMEIIKWPTTSVWLNETIEILEA